MKGKLNQSVQIWWAGKESNLELVNKSNISLLTTGQTKKPRDNVLRQGILYLESWLTKKMAD